MAPDSSSIPTFIPTLAMGWGVVALAVSFAVVCLALMLVVLAQKPKGGGLAGAFGGGGGSEGAFVGAKIGDFLTYITIAFFLAFIGLAMGLTWAINPTAADFEDADLTAPISTPEQTGETTTTINEDGQAEATATLDLQPDLGEIAETTSDVGDSVTEPTDESAEAPAE